MSIPVVLLRIRDCYVLDSSQGENTPTPFGQRNLMGLTMATVLNPPPSAASSVRGVYRSSVRIR